MEFWIKRLLLRKDNTERGPHACNVLAKLVFSFLSFLFLFFCVLSTELKRKPLSIAFSLYQRHPKRDYDLRKYSFKLVSCIPRSFSGLDTFSDKRYTLFFIRTSNFGAEAERSYCFCQFEPEMFLRCPTLSLGNVLRMFLTDSQPG